MKLSKGLVLLIVTAVITFLIGFVGGTLYFPNLGFTKTKTIIKQVPLLLTETLTTTNTTIVTKTIIETSTHIVTTTLPTTTTAVTTVFIPTTTTITRTITLTINIPATMITTPFVKIAKGGSIDINGWSISIATSYRQAMTNLSTLTIENNVFIMTTNYTVIVIVLQFHNNAPWARVIDSAMFSKIILVTISGRSYGLAELNMDKNFIAPGSYGFVELKFLVEENNYPKYLYIEILNNNMVVRIEFEL